MAANESTEVDNVAAYHEDAQVDTTKISQQIKSFNNNSKNAASEKSKTESGKINAQDVEWLQREFMLARHSAEKCLRQAGGNLQESISRLLTAQEYTR